MDSGNKPLPLGRKSSSSISERKSSTDSYGGRKSSSSLTRKVSNIELNRKRTISNEISFEHTMVPSNRDVTYGEIVNRTREKLQVVKALRMVRKTHHVHKVDSDDEDKDDIKKQAIFEQTKVKLSKMVDIKTEARKKVNIEKAKRLRALMNAKVETLHRFNNYGSVLKIVAEIDEAKKFEAQMRREAKELQKKELEASLLASSERTVHAPTLSPIIDLNSYMSPDGKQDLEEPEEDSDYVEDAMTVLFELKSPVTRNVTSPLRNQESPNIVNNPKKVGRSISMLELGTSGGFKSPGSGTNKTGNSCVPLTTPPGSGTKRRGSQMRGSVVDEKTKNMALMRIKAEELHRQALLNKLMAKEAKLMKSEKQKELMNVLKRLSMVTMLLSRVGVMYKLISDQRDAEANSLAHQKLLKAVVWVQRWWFYVKIKLKMKRCPLSVERIRVVVLTGVRIRRLQKMHIGIGLMKEFLFSSIILKDMVAKIYGYRKKAIRLQRWVRGYVQIRQARLLALSLYVTKIRNKHKAEVKERNRKQELKMRRALKKASGFGATMAKIDMVAKKINDTLDVEKEKGMKREVFYASREAAREKRLAADANAHTHTTVHSNATRNAPVTAGRVHRSKSIGNVRLDAGSTGTTMADVIAMASGSMISGPSAAERYFPPGYPFIKKKKIVRPKFPSPRAFIHQLEQTEHGRAQLHMYRHILSQLRKSHISSFEINERRRMLTTDCVRVEHVAQYLKPVDPNAVIEEVPKNKKKKINSVEDTRMKMEQRFKSKKQLAEEAAQASAYNDKMLLTEIIHSNHSLFNTPFLMLTSSKLLLLDEIRNLPDDIFI